MCSTILHEAGVPPEGESCWGSATGLADYDRRKNVSMVIMMNNGITSNSKAHLGVLPFESGSDKNKDIGIWDAPFYGKSSGILASLVCTPTGPPDDRCEGTECPG